jgi:hypothetical protein
VDAGQSSLPFIPGPSVNAQPLRGKTVEFVDYFFQNPNYVEIYAGFTAAVTLLRNPEINYVLEDGDFRTEYVVPALLAPGNQSTRSAPPSCHQQ